MTRRRLGCVQLNLPNAGRIAALQLASLLCLSQSRVELSLRALGAGETQPLLPQNAEIVHEQSPGVRSANSASPERRHI